MRIMLIQVEPPDDVQDFNFPMGYACLDSVLTRQGHEVELLFTVAHYLTDEKIKEKIKQSKAQIFGIGGMWPYLKRAEMLVKLIRQVRPDAKIILGGWLGTYLSELVMQKTAADFIIRGEGEIALLKLLNALERKKDYSHIGGLVFRDVTRIINNGLGELMPLEEIPMPNWEKFPMEYYMRTGAWYFKSLATGYDRVMSWSISRGCPGKCNFCTPGPVARYKSLEQVKNELHEIAEKFHPTFMCWMDNLTMGSKGYVKKFCEMLIREKFEFRYFMTGRVDIVDKEILKLLRESGCACILYGLESANNELLKFMQKNTTLEQFKEAVRLTKKADIGVNISAMFGQPGETLEDFTHTLEIFLASTDRKMPFSNNQGILPLTTFPGSPIYEWAKEQGYIKDDEDYYEKFFKYRWINYTLYPREMIEKLILVANGMNTWNYHYHAAKYYEDDILSVIALPAKLADKNDFISIKKFVRSRPHLRFSLVIILRILNWIILKLNIWRLKLIPKNKYGSYRWQIEDFFQFVRSYFK